MIPSEQEYPISEYALLFPEMLEEDFRQLVASIRDSGLLEPITLWRGQVIDGRHRLRACLEAGVSPRFVTLDDDADPLQYVLGRNLDRRHLDATQRALIACDLSLMSGPGGDRRSVDYQAASDHPAKVPGGFTQQAAADRLGVSVRLVRNARGIVQAQGPAAQALQQALRRGLIKVGDARKALDQPPEVVDQALRRVTAGSSRTLAAAVRQANGDLGEPVERDAEASVPAAPFDHAPLLHQASLVDLLSLVEPATVDVIITRAPGGSRTPDLFADLASFAAHALRDTGVLLVVANVERLPETLEQLKHPDIRWVGELDYRDSTTWPGSGPLSRVRMRRRPLLIYGKPGFRMPPGDDAIELAAPGEGALKLPGWQLDNAGLELIARRFARAGDVLCDPVMGGRPGTVLAARTLGCQFIGVDQEIASVRRVQRLLSRYE